MRNPNGFGTVVKLKGNRRNPYIAKKTKGWNDNGHPIFEIIGYYPTREAGLIALAQYNHNPWNLNGEKTTFAELFNLWLEKKAPKLGIENRNALRSAYKHCRPLANVRYKEIRAYHMQECIDQCGFGYGTQAAIKNLFYHLDRFALEMDIISRGYAGLTTSAPTPETSRHPFTNDEVARLWINQHVPWVDSVLVFLYTGFRISELLDLRTDDIDLVNGTITGGTKTKAGKNRIVPIHSKIATLIRRRVSDGGEYLFMLDGRKCPVRRYYEIWDGIMKSAEMKHTPHECRHTFRSWLDSAGANKRCIDLIMGHKSNDVGERIYTHKTILELKNTIKLVTN